MMRQEKLLKKIRNRIQKKIRTDQKCLRSIGAALCVMAALTGCGEADKALVFSGEGLTEDFSETTETVRPECETGHQTGDSGGEGTAEDAVAVIYVHVCGAVLSPGVVEVPEGSRAEDALDAAGGFAPDADREYVNLASPAEDGQQLYFPTIEEAERWRAGMTVSRSGQILTESTTGLININTADEAILCTLPGIGTARAQAIIAYRAQKGPFERPEDIMKVAGIKQSAFDKISTKITVE